MDILNSSRHQVPALLQPYIPEDMPALRAALNDWAAEHQRQLGVAGTSVVQPPGHCVPPGGVRTGEDLAAQHSVHRHFPAGCAALVRGAPAVVEDAGADHLRRRAAAGGGQHHLQYHHHHRRVVGVVLRGGGGAAVPDRHPQAGIFPQRAHRRRRDPGARLGTAAGHAGEGGGVRPAGAGGRAGVLRLCEAGTGGSTLDLTPLT
ncbi:hypothetical protein G6F65_018178 [Rhizopus arrhizus]|nr:hypothetical protein G6F65_018178 [Rhizopus arrhizus]